jgi:hypothetical protein
MGWLNLVALALAWIGQAESSAQSDAELAKAWLKVCTARAKDYRIHPAGKAEEEFQLLPKPVFYHNQPVRGDDIGVVYVWVQGDGRPAVVGAIFGFSTSIKDGSRTVYHEMHSLADAPLTATWQGQATSIEAHFEWKPIPDAPAPGESAPQRLRQMRLLSRRFAGHSIDGRGRRWELRLIPRPLYDYETKGNRLVLGGALFAFCQGTDTEIVLAIEARQTAGGQRWHYGCADFSDYGLYMRFDDAEVWKSPGDFMSGLKWTSKFYRIRLPEDDNGLGDKE